MKLCALILIFSPPAPEVLGVTSLRALSVINVSIAAWTASYSAALAPPCSLSQREQIDPPGQITIEGSMYAAKSTPATNIARCTFWGTPFVFPWSADWFPGKNRRVDIIPRTQMNITNPGVRSAYHGRITTGISIAKARHGLWLISFRRGLTMYCR